MRKTKNVVITKDMGPPFERDRGKRYLITEMPAAQAEKWAFRAFLALASSGLDVPENVSGMGMAGLAIFGLRALSIGGIQFADVEPLLDEMMGCVQIMPDPKSPDIVRPLREDQEDVAEIATRLYLRKAAFDLHVDFLPAGAS